MTAAPLVVGLTGGIGSGKSSAAACFRELGAEVVVADDLVSELLEDPDVLSEIRSVFGGELVGPDGLDRAAVANLVFADRAARRKLEMILHPRVAARAGRVVGQAARRGVAVVVYEVPLLLEIGAHQWVDEVVVVSASESVRVRRLMEQRGFSRDDALARIRVQVSDHGKVPGALVLDNDGPVEALREQVSGLYRSWRSRRDENVANGGVHGPQEE